MRRSSTSGRARRAPCPGRTKESQTWQTIRKIGELEAALKPPHKVAALEAKATAAETKVKNWRARSRLRPALGEDPKVKELEAKLADQAKASEEKIKELEAAIKKLEETPNPQTRTSGDGVPGTRTSGRRASTRRVRGGVRPGDRRRNYRRR